MINKLLIAGGLLAATLAPAFAEEMTGCTEVPKANWIGEDAAREKATQAGYDVRDLKVEGSCYEIYAKKDGARVEAVMDPSSGEIINADEGED
jgi:hypothetical protein